jgi:alpha-galactosidase
VLHYLSHTLNGSHVSVLLKDISRDVRVELRYDIDPESGILARSARIENHTGKPLVVQQAAAATWTLPGPGATGNDYVLHSLSGRWAAEWHLDHRPVLPSQTMLESRRGSTGEQNNPWFALSPGGTSEDDGACVVRRAGLERLVAHHRGAGRQAPGPRDRGLQPV